MSFLFPFVSPYSVAVQGRREAAFFHCSTNTHTHIRTHTGGSSSRNVPAEKTRKPAEQVRLRVGESRLVNLLSALDKANQRNGGGVFAGCPASCSLGSLTYRQTGRLAGWQAGRPTDRPVRLSIHTLPQKTSHTHVFLTRHRNLLSEASNRCPTSAVDFSA